MTISESDLMVRLMDSMDSLRGEISSLRVEMSKYAAGISLVDSRITALREEVKVLRSGVVETRKLCDNCDARKNIGNLSTLGRWIGVVLAVLVSVAALGQSLNWWGGGVVVNVERK